LQRTLTEQFINSIKEELKDLEKLSKGTDGKNKFTRELWEKVL